MTKSVARLRIGTASQNYTFIIPNVEDERIVDAMIAEAKELAITEERDATHTFVFPGERIRIHEPIIYSWCFIGKENYEFDTVNVNVTNR